MLIHSFIFIIALMSSTHSIQSASSEEQANIAIKNVFASSLKNSSSFERSMNWIFTRELATFFNNPLSAHQNKALYNITFQYIADLIEQFATNAMASIQSNHKIIKKLILKKTISNLSATIFYLLYNKHKYSTEDISSALTYFLLRDSRNRFIGIQPTGYKYRSDLESLLPIPAF